MNEVTIFCDGACSNNPGPGGWASILKYKNKTLKISGNASHTTNNRMELLAVINALKLLKTSCHVKIYTDSKYVVDSINKGWAISWQKNSWTKSNKQPALNSDLWEQLLHLNQIHSVQYNWIKGHNGHPENELCDKIAVAEYKKLL